MVEGSSAVNTSQQLEIQDVQRTRPTPEQRQGSEDVHARGSESVGRRGGGEKSDLAGEKQLTSSAVDKEQLDEIKESLNEALRPINIGLHFEEREQADELVVKVINQETEEVIRQIPPEAMLKMAQRIEEMTGLLVDTWR